MSDLYKLHHLSRDIEEGGRTYTLLHDINFEVAKGEFISVVGPSGSGKSSLLYLLGFLDAPTKGQIFFEHKDMAHVSTEELARTRLEKIGFIFQFHFLLPELSGFENIALPMRRLGIASQSEIKTKVMSILEELDLLAETDKKPHQMSGGQRQRIAIGRALANNPAAILADEPTGNLDTKNGDRVFDIFKRLVKEHNQTIIMVTHNTELADRTDRQLHIVDGGLSALP